MRWEGRGWDELCVYKRGGRMEGEKGREGKGRTAKDFWYSGEMTSPTCQVGPMRAQTVSPICEV